MMAETKRFPVDEVLCISNGCLVAKRHMDAVYDILNWMTNDDLFTHQLPRAGRECTPWLLRWFPELEAANNPHWAERLRELVEPFDWRTQREQSIEACQQWVLEVAQACGLKAFYDIPRIPRDDHDVKNPIQELVDMVGPEKVLIATPEITED